MLPPLLTEVRRLETDRGDTIKFLWKLHDGALVESVLVRYPGRITLCVSSKTGRRVSIEYALIKDMNDHAWRADLLADKLNARGRGWVHVNPIPLNPTPGSIWTASEVPVQNEFVRRLNDAGIPTTLRDTRGKEIDGACGQLVATEEDESAAEATPVG